MVDTLGRSCLQQPPAGGDGSEAQRKPKDDQHARQDTGARHCRRDEAEGGEDHDGGEACAHPGTLAPGSDLRRTADNAHYDN